MADKDKKKTTDVKVHRPRIRRDFDKLELAAMTDQIDIEGFVSFTIIPKFYSQKDGRFETLKGHSITARAFSIEALKLVLNGIEESIQQG